MVNGTHLASQSFVTLRDVSGESVMRVTNLFAAAAAMTVATLATPASALVGYTTLTVYDSAHHVVSSVFEPLADQAVIFNLNAYTVPGVAGNLSAFGDFDTIYVNGVATNVIGTVNGGSEGYQIGFTGPFLAAYVGGRNPIDLHGAPIDVSRFLDPSLGYTATFSGAAPEPASWALMIVGFGLVGRALRRRAVRPA